MGYSPRAGKGELGLAFTCSHHLPAACGASPAAACRGTQLRSTDVAMLGKKPALAGIPTQRLEQGQQKRSAGGGCKPLHVPVPPSAAQKFIFFFQTHGGK